MQFEDFASKRNVLAFLRADQRPKRNQKKRTLASSSTKTVLIEKRKWTGIEPEDYSPVAYPVSKQLSTLLRHGHLLREDDGAIEFWRLKDYLRNGLVQSQHWSDEKWGSKMAGGGGNKKRFQYCTDSSGQEILYLRALQGHSGRTPTGPELQDNVLIPNSFFEYFCRMCNQLTLHHKFRIDTGRAKFKQGKTHGHRYGKQPQDKEFYTANKLKKKCKKRQFLGTQPIPTRS